MLLRIEEPVTYTFPPTDHPLLAGKTFKGGWLVEFGGKICVAFDELPKPVAVESRPGLLPDSPAEGWVLRPDIRGRLGWESPDLDEDERHWAKQKLFDD